MQRDDEFELRVERLAAGGDGIGRGPDGRVVFVPWTAPGDRARVRATLVRARFARAELVALLEPGPSRAEPVCPVFGRCGGCVWQHLTPEAQLAAKAEQLREAVARIGGVTPPARVEVRPSPAAYAYRARARVHVEAGQVGFRRRRSHALCPTAHCPVLVPALDAALARMAEDPPPDGEWDLVASDDGRVSVTPHRRGAGGGPRTDRASVRLEGGEELGLSPGVFSQANALLRGALAEAVEHAAGEGACVLELYAGAGFFTVGLAHRFARVVAVEGHAPAVHDLRANLRRAGREHVEVVRAPVEEALALQVRAGLAPDVVVLDPPRQGLARGAAAPLLELAAPRIVYVSCDPATLARDLRVLAEGGYALRHLEGFDLFPQTSHVEAVAVLERARLPDAGGGVPSDRPRV